MKAKSNLPLCALVCCLLTVRFGFASEPGLPVGSHPQAFDVKDCTGPAMGKTLCYFCRYGGRPVVAIFTRQINDHVGTLVSEIESAVKKHREQRLAAFLVYVTKDTPAAEGALKDIARRFEITRTPLTILKESEDALQVKYGIPKETELMVMMWRGVRVHSNFPVRNASPEKKDVSRVVLGVEQLLEARR